ncbi:hypothetical protein [Desulfofustis limnaeus]|uniref:hypothetical protein n=1 Tax=Desulfofustis limnaeus TaxID=2740163 RepID=UPI0024DFE747|nr:hypothetical protein [Desulfofustis limnaeus]
MRQEDSRTGQQLSLLEIERIMKQCQQHRSAYIADMIINLLMLPFRRGVKH